MHRTLLVGALMRAIDFERRYLLSYRDTLIVEVARATNAVLLHSEHLGHGKRRGMIEVPTPFA